jgi:hypothetical protein
MARLPRSMQHGSCSQGQDRTVDFPSEEATFGIPASGRSERSRHAFSSLLDCLGRVRRVKAKPHPVAPRALTQRPRPEGRQLSRRTGEDQGAAVSPDRTAVRRAISGPLTPVTSGLSRSLADTPPRRPDGITGPDGTDSQADSAGSIPVTRSTGYRQNCRCHTDRTVAVTVSDYARVFRGV